MQHPTIAEEFAGAPGVVALRSFLVVLACLVPIAIAPRSGAVVLALLTLVAVVEHRQNGGARSILNFNAVIAALLALAAVTLSSAIWSPSALSSVGKAASLSAVVIALAVVAQAARRVDDDAIALGAARAVIAVYLFGAALAAFELFTDQSLLKALYSIFPSAREADARNIKMKNGVIDWVAETFINRRVFVVTLLSLPAWIAIGTIRSSTSRRILRGIVVVWLLVALLYSEHESSKLALVAGGAVLLVSAFSLPWAKRLVAVAWVVLVLFAVPIALGLAALKLDSATWLAASARDRVLIWNHTAKLTLTKPILGHGANATPLLYADGQSTYVSSRVDLQAADAHVQRSLALHEYESRERLAYHAHNIYLQSWFELGLVGAVALLLAGAAILRQCSLLPPDAARLWLVHFSMLAAALATSYGLWQLWLQAGIAVSVAAMFASMRAVRTG